LNMALSFVSRLEDEKLKKKYIEILKLLLENGASMFVTNEPLKVSLLKVINNYYEFDFIYF
jgi:hypothetical protein